MTEPRKRTILKALIIASLIPAVLLMSPPTVVTAKSVAFFVASVAGFVGMTILLWSYILGVKSVMGLVFRDLAPIITIHKWLGKWGTLALFTHPLLVVFSYGESWLYIFLPELSTRFERHVTLGRLAFLAILIVWITSALVRGRIKYRPWRYIHMLGYVALPFAFLHVPDVGSNFMSSTAVKAYYFGLIVIFVIFSLLRLRGQLGLDKERYQVIANRQLSLDRPSSWLIQLKPLTSRLEPAKGQYVYLQDGIISEEHPFSVMDYNTQTGEITIAYRTFGRFTTALSAKPSGSKLLLSGPYGTFTQEIEHEDKPVVFVAGGIGITPMVRYFLDSPKREQWLFYANRTKQSAVITPQLRLLLGSRLITIFSQQTDQSDPGQLYGRLDSRIFLQHLKNPNDYHYYICGPQGMMADVVKELIGLGVPASSIRREAFSW